MRIIMTFVTIALLLTGCGALPADMPGNNTNNNTLGNNQEYVLITDVSENEILVGSTFYAITEDTKVRNSQNDKLTINDLQPGDLIELKTTGMIAQSFPGQGEATQVILQTDEESLKISKAIRHFIDNQKIGNLISLHIKNLDKDVITLGFSEYDLSSNKLYEATIDRETNDFEVTEIPNEAILKEERKRNAAIKAGLSGSTAGHITEIYENGFRIGLVDYTLADGAVLTTDSGKELAKNALKIGSFVTVDYTAYKGDGIIKEATMNKLTLLESEEKPGVQEWIKFVLEGPLYKDPVIMFSYIGIGGESYTIQVADLKDDTWDTFELTYDFETKQHSIERIVHVPQKREVSPYEGITEYEIVMGIKQQQIIVSGNYFEINKDTSMETVDGAKIGIEDFEVGSLIQLEHGPIVSNSETGIGVATKIVLREDELYENITASIRYFIENQPSESIQSVYISGINDYGITLRYKDQEGKAFKALIDRKTNEFTVVEASAEDL